MVSTGQIPGIFGEPSGLGESAIKRALSVHRAAKQTPTSGKGGGIAAAHFEPVHYAYLLLGLGGSQPSDAAETAATLFPLVWHMTRPHAMKARAPGTIGEVLTAMVRGGWGEEVEIPERTYYFPDILLSPNFPRVELLWHRQDGHHEMTETYGPPYGVPYSSKAGAAVLRQTLIKGSLGVLAASLWRATPTLEPIGD